MSASADHAYRGQPLDFQRVSPEEMRRRAESFCQKMATRRSVRHFSPEPVETETLRRCIEAAASAPSGANKQPWTFVLVTDAATKRRIREAAEQEERAFYGGRAPATWLSDLEPLGTDCEKPFLEHAAALIVVFAHRQAAGGEKNYYVTESVGIAVGFLLAALHHAGLATLTHTPSPMGFLSEVLARPANERAYLLLPVGLPTDDCEVPVITRKPLAEVLLEVSGDPR